jgi:hypothetical protein
MGFDLSDIGDAFKDAGNAIVKGAESLWDASVDAAKAVWVGVQDLGNILAAPFKGPGGFVGLLVGGGVFIIECASGVGIVASIEGAIGYGAVAGAIANVLIKSQPLTQYEYDFACAVFGSNSLPARENIIKTNMYGIGGRPFTVPNAAGQIIMNLGPGYFDPTRWVRPGKDIVAGQTFIHEMTHAWQIQNDQTVDFVCGALDNQIRYTLLNDSSVYNPAGGRKQWSDYNLEQQATLIEMWYEDGCYFHHPFFRFVDGNIRQAVPGAGTRDPYQGNWRFCNSCQGLFFAGNGRGRCPANPAGHDGTGSWNYRLPLPKAKLNGYGGWRWCDRCQGLFQSGQGNGVCPADKPAALTPLQEAKIFVEAGRLGNGGAQGAKSGSKPLTPLQKAEFSGLSGMMNLAKANVLTGNKLNSVLTEPGKSIVTGTKPAGNAHSIDAPMPSAMWKGHSGRLSGHYRVPGLNFPGILPPGVFQDSYCGGQTGWSQCQKCQGLFYESGGASVCPAGGAHDANPNGHLFSSLYNTHIFNGTKWGWTAGGT